jgi:hypothetical protein
LIFAEAGKADATHPRIVKRLDMSEMDHLSFSLYFLPRRGFFTGRNMRGAVQLQNATKK